MEPEPLVVSLATRDTHEVVKDLVGAGFTDEQAAAVARNLRKAQDLDISSLATKVDLEKVRIEVEKVRIDVEKVRTEVEKGRTEVEKLRGEFGKIPGELKREIAESKADILKSLIGMIGFQTLIILTAVVALIKFVKP